MLIGRDLRAVLIVACVGLLVTACAPARSGDALTTEGKAEPAAKKRIVAALLKPNLPTLRDTGGDRTQELILAGLGRVDIWGVVHPQLAEQAPTVENGLWKLLPDGRMGTTWKIRPEARWHDGVPITSADYLFGTTVAQDKEMGSAISAVYASIEGIEAPDPQTVTIKWKKPYIEADAFSSGLLQVLPQHLLAAPYAENKASFYALPYWSASLVHAGPYQVKQWLPDSHAIFEAFDGYVLGRPKIDQIEVKFIGDTNTLVANLLAGAVDLTLGQSISPEQAAELKEGWRGGSAVTSPVLGSSVGIMFQHIDPNPAVIGDVRFRRALTHAFNRQELVDTVMRGQVPIAHAIVGGLRQGIDDVAVKYDFDLRRAGQLMEEMGYRKGADGIYQDPSGKPLTMEVRGIQEEEPRVKTTLTSEANWRALGVATNLVMVPAENRDDRYLATWPATVTKGIAAGLSAGLFAYFHSSRVRLPENNFLGGSGPRYINPELDSLLDRALATVPRSERDQIIDRTVRHLTENAVAIGAFYTPYNSALSNRLVNITTSSTFAQGWDAHVWDMKS